MSESEPPHPDDLADGEGTADATADPTGGPAKGPLARLFDGDADGPPVGQMERDYGLPKPLAVAGRGAVRVGTGSGVPPFAEIMLGGLLFALAQQQGGDGGEESADDEPFVPDEMDP